MSKDWYLMNSKPYFNSGFEKQEHTDYAYDGFNEILDTTVLGEEIVIFSNGDISEKNGINLLAIVQNNTTNVINGDNIKQILCNIGTFKYGQYVLYKNEYYLITDIPGDNQFYEKAAMTRCNHLLKWINNSGEIIERYCVFTDATKLYASGTRVRGELVIGDMTTTIYLPQDKETINIPRDFRFIIENELRAKNQVPMTYKSTKINAVEKYLNNSGLLILGMAEDEFNEEVDNRELLIANYYDRIANYSLKLITPRNITLKIGDIFQIQAQAKNKDIILESAITFSTDNKEIGIVSDTGLIEAISIGECSIEVLSHGNKEIVKLNVIPSDNPYQNACVIEYRGEAALKIGGVAKTFSAKFYNSSGESVNSVAQWEIMNNPSYIIITKQNDSSISLKCQKDISLIGNIVTLILKSERGLSQTNLELEIVGLL